MMKNRLLILTFASLTTLAISPFGETIAQVSSTAAGAPRVAQQHLIGEVTAIDQTSGQITVKTDAGASVNVMVNAQTVFRRLPAGETSLSKAETITNVDVKVGDRVLVPSGASLASGVAARQVIVMAREAVAARRDQQREDWRTRGVNGRVLAIDAAKKELSIETRTRDSAQTLTVVTSGNTRIRRYAPGSLRPDDAVAGTFADIRVGDQLRALGNREDFRINAEEIISGTVARLLGFVEKIDPSRNEVVVKEAQTGKITTISLLPATTLRRVPADFAQTLAARGEQGRGGRGGREGRENLTEEQRAARREQRAARQRENQGAGGAAQPGQPGQPGAGPQRPGARSPQQMFENFPVITVAEVKKGDAVMVTGTGNDASRVVAATLITGDAEILERLLRRGGRPEGMSPGLPSGVMGGGTGGDPDRPQPATPPK